MLVQASRVIDNTWLPFLPPCNLMVYVASFYICLNDFTEVFSINPSNLKLPTLQWSVMSRTYYLHIFLEPFGYDETLWTQGQSP